MPSMAEELCIHTNDVTFRLYIKFLYPCLMWLHNLMISQRKPYRQQLFILLPFNCFFWIGVDSLSSDRWHLPLSTASNAQGRWDQLFQKSGRAAYYSTVLCIQTVERVFEILVHNSAIWTAHHKRYISK